MLSGWLSSTPAVATATPAVTQEDLELAQYLDLLENYDILEDWEFLELLPLLEESDD